MNFFIPLLKISVTKSDESMSNKSPTKNHSNSENDFSQKLNKSFDNRIINNNNNQNKNETNHTTNENNNNPNIFDGKLKLSESIKNLPNCFYSSKDNKKKIFFHKSSKYIFNYFYKYLIKYF